MTRYDQQHRHTHRHRGGTTKSQSIPIIDHRHHDGNSSINAQQQQQRHEEEEMIMADYADYVFCERLVNGMQRKVSFGIIRDIGLRYENQALIDHIIETRRRGTANGRGSNSRRNHYDDDDDGSDHHDEEFSPPSSPPTSPTLRPRIITMPHPAQQAYQHKQEQQSSSIDDDEDMIFDMEL